MYDEEGRTTEVGRKPVDVPKHNRAKPGKERKTVEAKKLIGNVNLLQSD